ncbi:MAG: S-layer homology domain-containing protein [Paenibacillaceae bacterium]|nr:S-layer homology domain-containing protein [Paenibacillaceae bacterium]
MVDEGTSFQLSVTASGGTNLTYQWYRNDGTNTFAYGSSQSTGTITITGQGAGTVYFYCIVTNTDPSATGQTTATSQSETAVITVNSLANAATPNISEQPVAITKKVGEQIALHVEASSASGVLSYQWIRNVENSLSGGAFVVGATDATLTIQNQNLEEAYYYCLVTNRDDNAPGNTTTSVPSDIVKVTILLPDPPVTPQHLVAAKGNRRATLNWDSVTGATYYNIYKATEAGQYTDTPAAVSYNNNVYTLGGLTNGSTYYFVVQAANLGGVSSNSDEVSVIPQTVPAKPTNVSAAAGDGQAIVSFTAPTNNGGSEITGYKVSDSSGNHTATGTASPITVGGLSNGTSYTFTVKAINGVGEGTASDISNAVVPEAPSPDPVTTPSPSPSPTPAPSASPAPEQENAEVGVIVNGKVDNAGTATTSEVNGKKVTTVVIDQQKLEERLAAEGKGAAVTIPVRAKSDVVIGELNGEMVKTMEANQSVIQIQTEQAAYTIPARQINIAAVSEQLGQTVDLKDIKIQIEIAVPAAETVKLIENAANGGSFTLVVPSVEFTIRATYNDKPIEISKFDTYVERSIALPDDIDPTKITTGVVIDPDGTVRHIPTKVVLIDGKYYAQMKSTTNSAYSVIWHPIAYSDVVGHWAQDIVNDMGSRMVIEGAGNDLIQPQTDITRAEFTNIVIRGLGLKLETGSIPFSDVNAADWNGSKISTAYAYKLINGFEDGTFRPDEKITREQAMVIIANAMMVTNLKTQLSSATEATLQPFVDAAEASAWAQSSIADNVQSGIVEGRGASLAPKAYLTKAEAAALVYRLLKKSDLI